MPRIATLFTLIAVGLIASCTEQGDPFPFEPNMPDDFNRSSQYQLRKNEVEELLGNVAMVTHEVYNEYYEGLVSEHAACFDSSGHCLELYYRDRENNQRYTFSYDSLGRRVEEVCYIDSAGTRYDSLTQPYMTTTYHYSHNGRTCRARITTPNGKHYTYRLRYDRKGRLHRFIYPDGSRFTYEYDNAGRMVRTTYPDASMQLYEYDSTGRLTHLQDRDGVHHWFATQSNETHYDTLGRIAEELSYDNGNPVVTSYIRDEHGNWTRRIRTGLSTPTRIDNRTFKYFTK
ncbi:MAG: RHS repeat protein [Bacteroidales bacterium]|nr:RHS repeat protein [Bacteroidales bacterium]